MKHEPRKKKQTNSPLSLGHRALALLLALLMIVTATGMQVFAEGDETEGSEQAAEVQEEPAVPAETESTTTEPAAESVTPTDTTTTVDAAPASTEETPAESTSPAAETPADESGTAEPAVSSCDVAAAADNSAEASGATPDPYNISDKITKSAMNYYPDGKTPTAVGGQTVTAGSYVSVTLEFKEIEGLAKGQKLTYTIPSSYMTAYSVTASDNAKAIYYTWASSGEKVAYEVGTYTVSGNVVTITPSESYLNADTDKIDLPGGQFTFIGKLSTSLGTGDVSLTFGKATALKFTIQAATNEITADRMASGGTYDLTNYLTTGSYINVIIGEDELTLDELTASGKQVPEGAGVHVKLVFASLKNIPAGDTLTYQIPTALVVQAVTTPTKLLDSKTGETLGSFVIDDTGLITVTISDSYHSKYQHGDGTLDLEGFNLFFYGSFSNSMGQVDGSEDNKISFSGSASSNGLTFTIPFDYKNDHANVQIEKTGEFTSATTIKYTVTVTAPTDNTEEAYNVVVTDNITTARGFVKADDSKDNEGNLYRNYEADNGTFDPAKGVWTIDGNMKPGQSHTLTYELELSDEYYTNNPSAASISNTATVTFNECGKNQDVDQQSTPGTVLLTKEYKKSGNNPVMTKDDQGTYLTYTLTATAYGAKQDGIVVEDAFTTPDYISYIVADEGYQGTVQLGNDQKSLTWTVGSLDADASASLTYRAYLNADAWIKGASYDSLFEVTRSTKNVQNTATVSVNNGTSGSAEPLVTNTKSTTTSIQKAWLRKTSSKVTSGDHNGTVLFTIKANEAPSVNSITTIWDKLTDGTYEENGVITINRYSYSTNNVKLKDSTTVNVADVLDSGSTTSWTIDLQKVPKSDGSGTVDLSGAYYYEVSYYVTATGISVINQAGIGFGNGGGFDITKEAQGASGWTYGNDFSKGNTGMDYETGEDKWTITLKKTVTSGMAVYDTISTPYVYSYGSYWFDKNSQAGVVVKQGDTVLELGKDYTVELLQDTTDGNYKSHPVAPEVRSDGIQINFLHDIEVTGSNDYVTINYSVMFDVTPYDESMSRDLWRANWVGVKLPVYGELQAQPKQYVDASYSMNLNRPLIKGNGTYNATDGTISWNLEVNNYSTVGGDATLIDLLPEGLTFYSAEITAMGALAEDNTHRTATTMNGVGKNVILYADDCDVEDYSENGKNYSKVSLYIKDLSRFETISGGVLKKDTYNPVVGTGHGGYAYGRITVKITAKVDAGLMASLSEATKVTNTAILTDNKYLPTGGVTATGDATIPATGSTVLSKSQASTDAPAYVQFALDINTGAMDLVANDGTLAIDDVMGSGMTMATSHKNCFRVYDVTNVSDLYKSDGSVDSSKAATGSDITEQCSWEATKEANTYRFTVPDATHVVIVYWASYSGVAGQKVQLANNAYFYYEGKDYSNNSSKWSAKLQVSGAGGDAYTDPYFFLQKQDQWGNNVSGAVFGVYKYVAGGDDVLITTRTTENGQAYIGHRSDDSFAKLELNTVYAIKEIQAPVGYTLDSTEHYFEFVQITGTGDEGEVTEADIAAHAKNHPTGITVVDISPGGTYTVTNTFTGASLTIPVVKTINGKNLSSTTEFSFTLKQTSGATVYTDTDYKKAVSDQGMTVTIKGSGSDCYTLYFKTLGDYTFTLTEDDLSDAAKACGYSEKDSTEYQVKVTVGTDPDTKQIKVTSATFTPVGKTGGDILNGNVLTFNNKLSLEGSLSLQVKKIVSGRTAEVRDGEFSFNVLKNGEVITDSKGNALVFKTQEGGLVNITIPLTQEDIGTQDYVIKEVVPTGSAADSSISYVASPVIATVTISEIAATANAKAHVAATSDVTYTAEQTDKSGVALMVNKYSASGSITLVGSKIYTQLGSNKSLDIGEKQFTFTVKEGNTIVATGYTETNGDITFTPINYIQTDVGEHTYTITEDSYTTPFIDFDDTAIKVKVVVTDLGGGKLKAEVADTSDTVIFHNTATTLLPTTGIRLDVLPYVLILILALGCGALMLRRRKHTRG